MDIDYMMKYSSSGGCSSTDSFHVSLFVLQGFIFQC